MNFVPPAYVKYFDDHIFQTNLQALSTIQKPLAEKMAVFRPAYNQPFSVEPSQSGDLTLKFTRDNESYYFYSTEDPWKQAKEWVAEVAGPPASIYIVFGFGLGYQLQVLRQVIAPGVKVLVVERSPEVFWLAMWTVDLRDVLSDSRFRFAVDMESFSVAHWMYQSNVSPWDALTAQLYEFHHLTIVFDEYYEALKQGLQEYFQTQQIAASTQSHFNLTWTLNFLQNLPIALTATSVQYLYRLFPGVPAVIVAAGPSLEKNIDWLHNFSRVGLIIATGQTLRTLLKEGIHPHVVASIDGGEPNWHHFRELDVDEVPLVFDSTIYPSILQNYKAGGRRFCLFAPDKKELYGIVPPYFDVQSSTINVGASVANLGLNLAYNMGCNPIVFVGQDLAFTDGVSHFSDWGEPQKTDQLEQKQLIETTDIYGQRIYTQDVWLAFRNWFRYFIESHPDRQYINATEGGIGIPGAENRTLQEVIAELNSKQAGQGPGTDPKDFAPKLHQMIEQAYASGQGELLSAAPEIANELLRLNRHLKVIIEECHKGIELTSQYQRLLNGKMDVRDRLPRYYEKLAGIQKKIEADKKSMEFLKLAFRPTVERLEQSVILSATGDDLGAVRQDVYRAAHFFREIESLSQSILTQAEKTVRELDKLSRQQEA